MRIPDDIQWDSFDEDEEPRMTNVSSHDRIRLWFEAELDSTWAQLMSPAVDAYVATQEIIEYLSEKGLDIDLWPEEYAVAPLLSRASRLRHKQH